ncbi:MAG: sulfotransferase [Phycisphaerales bacterium]|nr:sulfotransferase [Phycisphaerales bacterium]
MGQANAKQAVQRAQQLIAQGQFRQASAITAQLTQAFPTKHPILLLHASTLHRRGLYQQAIAEMTKVIDAISTDSDHYPVTMVSIARSQAMMGQLDESIQTLLKAQRVTDTPPIAAALVDRYLDLDNHEQAQAVLASRSITTELPPETDPVLACAWARANKDSLPNKDIIKQLTAVADTSKPSTSLLLVLGRLLEKAERYDEAFARYLDANAANKDIYQQPLAQARLKHIRKEFRSESLNAITRPQSNTNQVRPILIVGMPRSGTSLVEQILSAHPQIAAAGESQAMPEMVSILTKNTTPAQLTERLVELQASYLDELKSISSASSQPMITDKNPMNLFLLAHALAIVPDAIVIRVQRDPRDVCLSCFTSPLALDHTYKFNLKSCAHFASTASKVLDHCKPIVQADSRATWVDVSYEALTQSPQNTIEALFESIGLEPHEDCFNFHQSTRAVQTISRDQVRQPMHTDSIARWQNFAHHPEMIEMISTLRAEGLID